jgi:hypothetical protein
MERCFINAIVGCIEIYWYANAQNLTEKQVETYRRVISNAQSHIVVLHHVRVAVMNRLSMTTFQNAKIAEAKRKKKEEDNLVDCNDDSDVEISHSSISKLKNNGGKKKKSKNERRNNCNVKIKVAVDEEVQDEEFYTGLSTKRIVKKNLHLRL